jgi:hypothetical protein
MDKAHTFTPGPWEVGKHPSDANCVYGLAGRLAIANQGEANINLANARLIAAAPELLQVANKAFDFLGGVDGAAEIRAELLSAIAKATQP